MPTTTLLRKYALDLVAAINNALPVTWNTFVSDYAIMPSSSSSSSSSNHMTIWCKNHQGKLTAIQVFINDNGDFFTSRDDIYPLVKLWLSDISSRERQHIRADQIRDELLNRVALKFEPMASF